MTPPERGPQLLRPQDATLWSVQAPDAPLQIGAIALFDAAPLRDDAGSIRIDDLRRHVEARLQGVPRFRQRPVNVALDQGIMWTDDPDFDVARHVRLAALPHPGGEAQLRELVTGLIEVPLDPNHPLWELWVVEGLTGDRLAVIPKVSHVMADGMALLEFAFSLLDVEPTSAAPGDDVPAWAPGAHPSGRDLLLSAIRTRGRRQAGRLGELGRLLVRPAQLAATLQQLAGAAAAALARAAPLPFTRPVGAHRDIAWTRLPRAGLEQVKQAEGVTLNDVVLAVTAGGLARYLERAGVRTARPPRVIVPVSAHGRSAGEEIENRFSLIIADLPIALTDPIEQLRAVHAEMRRHKEAAHAALGPALFGLGDLLPPSLLRAIGPPLLRRQPFVNLAVTNLPGTRDPLYLLGARLRELYPYVGVTGNIALIIGVISYEDFLGIGVTVDARAVPDVDRLVESIERAAAELVTQASPSSDGPAAVTPPRATDPSTP